MSHSVLFIGLGVMGFHMAGHLSKHVTTYIYNRTPTKTQQWLKTYKGNALEDLSDIPDEIDTVITCIGNDLDLHEIYLSESGLINRCKAGINLIDHTTASASIAKEIALSASKKQLNFIDAPVSGGEQGAINGTLTTMCGGEPDSFETVKVTMQHYSKAVTLMGKNGAGQLTKMANQIAVAGVVQGLAEAIHFGEQAGLDCYQLIEVISKGAAQSWQMDNRSETMIKGEYKHGFAVDLMRKDLDICLTEGRKLNTKLPITALIDQFYADVQGMGGNRWDTSSLLERLRIKH